MAVAKIGLELTEVLISLWKVRDRVLVWRELSLIHF